MSYASVEQRRFGLKKEGTRGTAESAPSAWWPIDKDTKFNYDLNHLKDDALRGIPDMYPSVAGPLNGTGKLKLPLDAQACGELFYSLLGDVSSAQQGGSAAYKHTFTRDLDSIERTAYTFFMDYGTSIVKKYNLGVVKAITLTGPVDQLVTMDADILFKSEADGSIGSPSFPTQRYMAFPHTTIKLGGVANTDIRSWQLKIDGGSQPLRTLSQSQDIANILVKAPLNITGNFVIYFQTDAIRDAFLANTTTTFQALIEHDIIASTYKYTVDINLYKIQYKAVPFGEQEGLLAANVDFDAVYSTSDSKTIQVDVTNAATAY